MAEVQPFQAWRYDVGQVGDLTDVVAPPYDVIDENFQEDLDETYDLHDATVDGLEPSKTDNPVAKALREHSEKYPLKRKEELDAEHLRKEKEMAKKLEEIYRDVTSEARAW